MSLDHIRQEVTRLKEQYEEQQPLDLCRALDILILFAPMGRQATACKGFYLCQSRIRSITINSDLTPDIQRIIAAHELGHAVLHSHSGQIKAFHDFQLFDQTSVLEYEANIFAADLLMTDSDVLACLNDDISFFDAAALLHVPPELLDFKFRMMKRQGYRLLDSPLTAKSTFLKDMEVKP